MHLAAILRCGVGCVERKHGLDADVQSWYIKSLEHDFRGCLPVLWGVQRWLCEHEVVLLAVHPQVPAWQVAASPWDMHTEYMPA